MLAPLAVALCLQPLTLERVGDVASILAEIGSATGQKLQADPELARCMVFIRFNDAAQPDVLNQLASSLSAEWDKRTQSWKLTRKAELRAEIRRREIAWLQPQIAACMSDEANKPASAQAYEKALVAAMITANRGGQEDTRGPAEGLMFDLMRSVGPVELAKGKAYEIRSFSNRPTASENALPTSSSAVIAKYVKLETDLGLLLSKWGPDRWDTNTRDRIVNPSQNPERIGRVLLDVYRTDGSIYLNATVYGVSGKIHSWGQRIVPLKDGPSTEFSVDGTYHSVTQERQISDRGFGGPMRDALPEFVRSLRPIEYDPLQIQAIPGLLQVAKARQILVPLPDLIVPTLLEQKPQSVHAFVEAVKKAGVNLSDGEGWLTGGLRSPFAIDRMCLPRSLLQRWLTDLQNLQADPFRSSAQLCFACGDAISTSPLDNWYRRSVFYARDGRQGFDLRTPRWLSFFLGSLNDAEWKNLTSGGAILLNSTPARKRWMTDWSNSAALAFQATSRTADVYLKGTMSFPNGPPANATLSLDTSTDIFLRGGEFATNWWPLDGYADLTASQIKQPTAEAVAAFMKGPYDLGTQGKLVFRAHFDPNLSLMDEQPVGGITLLHDQLAFANWPTEARKFLTDRAISTFGEYREGDRKGSAP